MFTADRMKLCTVGKFTFCAQGKGKGELSDRKSQTREKEGNRFGASVLVKLELTGANDPRTRGMCRRK